MSWKDNFPKEKRYFETSNGILYNGDCLEILKRFPNECIDMILTDPPYGDNLSYGRNNKTIMNNETPLLNCNFIWESQRLLKNNKVLFNFTNWKHYPFLNEFIIRYTSFFIRTLIVLNKSNFGMGYGFRNKHELCFVLEKGKPQYYKNDFPNVLDFKVINHDKYNHPHEKPLGILRKKILHTTLNSDIILDSFVGSGSTAVVCEQLGRRWIGIELNKDYCETAKKRILNNKTLHNWW